MTNDVKLQNIILEQNPYNPSSQVVQQQHHLMQTPPFYINNQDFSWNVFKIFGHLYMWEEFVCLYILALNFEEDISGVQFEVDNEINSIQYYISGLSNDLSGLQETNQYKYLVNRYWNSRKSGDVNERDEVMKFIDQRLETHYFRRQKTELIECLSRMPKYQIRALRDVFISRIYGYANFVRRYCQSNNQILSNETENRNSSQQESNVENMENNSIDKIKKLEEENKSLNSQLETSKIEWEIQKKYLEEEKIKNTGDLIDVKVQVNELTKQLKDKEESHESQIKLLETRIEILKSQSSEMTVVRDDKNIRRELERNSNKQRRDHYEHGKKFGGKNIKHNTSTRSVSWKNTTQESEKILFQGRKTKSESKDEIKEKPKEELNVSIESSTENEIEKLKQENIKLRAALGDIMNLEWHDDDENNSMQLVKEIENLNRNLNKITGVKRNVKEIRTEAVANLFSSFNCTTSADSKQMKLVLSAALQQHLINFILKSADVYFSQALKDISEVQGNDFTTCITEDKLEAVILSRTNDLIKLTTRFEETHTGTDEHSRILPVRLRQQIYAALGHRGFSNPDHPFITQLSKNLMDEMDRYRILESEERIEKEIISIVFQVLRIFYFRLETQDPIPSIEFYKSSKDIDPVFMEGMWEGYYEDYEVEICSFPAIFIKSDERVYTKAQVIARPKKSA